MLRNYTNKIFISSFVIALLRLIYIYFLKEIEIENQFNAYVFTFSALAFINSSISPFDAMCSRFANKNNDDNLYGYLIFHLLLRLIIGSFIFLGIISISTVLYKVDLLFVIAIAAGIYGMVVSNLIYIINIGRGINTTFITFIFIAPIIIKCIVLTIGYFLELTFREIVLFSEFTQFVFCIFYAFLTIKKYKTISSVVNIKEVAKNFMFELKNYGSNNFILIPISYIKTNFAPALAANSLNYNETFIVLLIQRGMDLIKNILGRINILTSGIKNLYRKTNSIFKFWIIPLVISLCITAYVDIFYESLLLFFVSIRVTELFAYFCAYGAHSDYLKLSTYRNNRHVVLIPAIIFIISLLLTETLFGLSLYIFAWLFLLRSFLASFSYYIFAKKNIIK